MTHTESNPIQQRIDKLGEKWNVVKENKKLRLVRLLYEDNEEEMIDCFYNYMLGVNTPIEDIPIKFESSITDSKTYSQDLLLELEEIVNIWNRAEKSKDIEDIEIKFVPDYTYEKDKNRALHFIHNFSNLINSFELDDDQYGVIILTDTYSNPSKLKKWLNDALKVMHNDKVKILIAEKNTAGQNFDSFGDYDPIVTTIVCNLEMDKAISQVAAMGNPRDPATSFRVEFMKMFQSIEKRKKAETEKYGDNCIAIALKNAEKDPYWLTQIVTVYTALSNDQIGYKDFKKAISFANLAVAAAQKTVGQVDDEISLRLIGQTSLYRGSLFCQIKDWFKAVEDFVQAKEHYKKCNDVVMGIESCRMASFASEKSGISKQEKEYLAEGFVIAENASVEVIKSSSFPLLIHAILRISNFEIETSRVKKLSHTVYGDEWESYIENIYNPELQNS
jgi:hypothetical protein